MPPIVINAEPRKLVTVTMVGKQYKVKPPKMSILAVVAKASAEQQVTKAAKAAGKKGQDGDSLKVLEHIENLVKIMFGTSAAAVLKRLEDPKDDLDYQHLIEVAEAVIEGAAENPTS